MSFTIDRRLLIKASIVGLAALPVPGVAQILSLRGFTHGVASGEPGANSVLLWTRYVGSGDSKLRVEVATDPAFAKVMSGGEVTAPVADDYVGAVLAEAAGGRLQEQPAALGHGGTQEDLDVARLKRERHMHAGSDRARQGALRVGTAEDDAAAVPQPA